MAIFLSYSEAVNILLCFHSLLWQTNKYITNIRIDWIELKNERIDPFLGTFLIYPKYLYKEVPRCFGIFVQICSRISNDSSNFIRLIISIGMLKICTFSEDCPYSCQYYVWLEMLWNIFFTILLKFLSENSENLFSFSTSACNMPHNGNKK